MSCTDIPAWYLRQRIAVLDLRSAAWERAQLELLPPGYPVDVCMRRMAVAGRLRRLKKGAYLVVDPVRETPSIAVASGLYADTPHHVTTDAALAFHGLLDQPVPTITVVLAKRGRAVAIGGATVRPVSLASQWLKGADAYETTVQGFAVRVAAREQAVVDALAEPAWMTHGSLLPEILAAFSEAELARTADRALARSTAAAQRLGYLLEDTGRELPPALGSLRPKRAVHLRPGQASSAPYSSRWRVYG
jgi:predicted transcriptional regulator of viral defense system